MRRGQEGELEENGKEKMWTLYWAMWRRPKKLVYDVECEACRISHCELDLQFIKINFYLRSNQCSTYGRLQADFAKLSRFPDAI